mgnify:CR=1 FL=1
MKTVIRYAACVLLAAGFTGCSTNKPFEPSDTAPHNPIDVSGVPDAVPKQEPLSRYGNPDSYVVYGKRYHTLESSKGYRERGLASWYGTKFHGRRTSSGEPYDLYAMTAAHKTLPLPTYVEVTNLDNGRSVVVKVNDRGPFHEDRIIDLSYAAAVKLGTMSNGTGRVEVRALDAGIPVSPALAAAPAFVPAAAEPRAGQALYLQVGAFGSQDNAERLRRELQQQDVGTVRIVEADSDAGTLYKVQVGPLSGNSEADQIARSLKSLGINQSRSIVQ